MARVMRRTPTVSRRYKSDACSRYVSKLVSNHTSSDARKARDVFRLGLVLLNLLTGDAQVSYRRDVCCPVHGSDDSPLGLKSHLK